MDDIMNLSKKKSGKKRIFWVGVFVLLAVSIMFGAFKVSAPLKKAHAADLVLTSRPGIAVPCDKDHNLEFRNTQSGYDVCLMVPENTHVSVVSEANFDEVLNYTGDFLHVDINYANSPDGEITANEIRNLAQPVNITGFELMAPNP